MPNPAPKKPRLKHAASILIHAPDYAFETEHGAPAKIVCGIDEAGRGPLAGPVVAAAAMDDVFTVFAEEQVGAKAGGNCIVASACKDQVVSAAGDD